jgi:ribosomal protein S18 acetylase RimI-like enzyme
VSALSHLLSPACANPHGRAAVPRCTASSGVLAAALGFKRAQLLAAVDRVEPVDGLPGALALWTPSLERVWELNLLVARGGDARGDIERAAGECERLQAAAGLGHRKLRFADDTPADLVTSVVGERGWRVERDLVMVHGAGADRPGEPGRVEDLDPEALARSEDEFLRAEPYGRDDESRRQLVAQHDRWARFARTARRLGIVEDGRVVAWCRMYDDGALVELDAVGVVPAERGRGLGRALMEGALALAPADRPVFLLADADDWPRELYEKLGFEVVGERVGVTGPDTRRDPF